MKVETTVKLDGLLRVLEKTAKILLPSIAVLALVYAISIDFRKSTLSCVPVIVTGARAHQFICPVAKKQTASTLLLLLLYQLDASLL